MYMYMHYAHCTCIYIRFVTQSCISRLRYSDCTFLWEKTIGVFLRSRRGANIESFNMLFHSCFFICLEISTKMASFLGVVVRSRRGANIGSFNMLFHCCLFLCLEISTKMASVWGFWLWEAAEEPIQVISCQAFPILLKGGHTDWEYIWYLIESFNILFQCCVFL